MLEGAPSPAPGEITVSGTLSVLRLVREFSGSRGTRGAQAARTRARRPRRGLPGRRAGRRPDSPGRRPGSPGRGRRAAQGAGEGRRGQRATPRLLRRRRRANTPVAHRRKACLPSAWRACPARRALGGTRFRWFALSQRCRPRDICAGDRPDRPGDRNDPPRGRSARSPALRTSESGKMRGCRGWRPSCWAARRARLGYHRFLSPCVAFSGKGTFV